MFGRNRPRPTHLGSWPLALVLVAAALVLATAPSALGAGQILASQEGLPDVDARAGAVAPTAAQLNTVSSLGAHATWNRFGTPQSLIKYGGYLAAGLSSDPVTAARSFISSNAGLFRLSAQGVSNLELLSDSPMIGSEGHAVLFRQTFGGLPATQDGLITLGVVGGKIAYVSSSSAGDGSAPAEALLSPAQAWAAAATDVGRQVSVMSVLTSRTDPKTGWTGLKVAGFADYQRVRLTALPTYTQGVRPAYEVLFQDTNPAWPSAYKEYIDALTGATIFRQNAVQEAATCDAAGINCTYSGELPVGATVECGPYEGPFAAPTGTKSIDAVATEDVAINDIILELHYGQDNVVASSDILFSPEAIHYEPSGGVPAGSYYIRICPFTHSPDDYTPPYTYHGTITINTAAGTTPPLASTPKWQVFEANPPLDLSTTDTRVFDCWLASLSGLTPADAECQVAVANSASRAPWDFDVQANAPTGTTKGNNANTAEAWGSPLTPGGAQRPVQPDRRYAYPWTNVWQTSKCSPSNFTPGGNDIFASVTNLFVGHNRMHDFSYNLGFTETNFNAQQSNFGNTNPGPYPAGREADPEIGDSQAGAVSGGAPSYLGRDNANQITLNDGVSPITNQYLWQPIAGAFYSPCVDGGFDTSVFGHEYTHLISNRMVAGPDSGLSGYQAGSMGESWSDLDAVEYLNENGYVPTNGENPFSVGAYVTGNPQKGIRDYSIDDNPLNYSDLGFDTAGPEVHADGEIWNGVNWSIRQALVDKYNATFPASDSARQAACAAGKYAADACPGNRRWIQIVYDAWLLMPSAVSMVDARDAYLAADQMRFGGANQTELWRAFSQRGLGIGAHSAGTADNQATPSFESPAQPNATVTFDAVNADALNAHVNATVYVGKYEDRAVPIADTDAGTTLSNTAQFVPGTYDFIVQAPGYGLTRFTKTIASAQATAITFQLQTNWASAANGAVASGDGSDLGNLIDDTENSNWTATGRMPSVDGTTVTVKLGGGAHQISSVRVSAMLNPGQNRFSALRKFELWACNSATADCSSDAGFSNVYTSADDAFPGARPRPVSPDLIIRTFQLSAPVTATHLRLVVKTNQCTGIPGIQTDDDNDPANDSGCVTGSARDNEVRAAELEAFSPPTADLSVTKTGPATLKVGSLATYSITVKNDGPAAASGVVAIDKLPFKAEFRSVKASQGTCTKATVNNVTSVTCKLGSMASGSTATITIVAKLRVTGTATNTVSVSEASPGDSNSSNDTATWNTTVTP